MRSPGPAFDIRAALSAETSAALEALDAAPHDPQALHRCRVALKRARALAQIGAFAAPGLSKMFIDGARLSMGALSQARDADALVAAALAAAKKAKRRAARALTKVAARMRAGGEPSAQVDYDLVRAGLRDLLALAQVWPEASPRQIARGARHLRRRARRARRRGCGSQQMGARHQWRKREKDRLFAAEILGDAWPTRRRRKKLTKLGNLLGDERDVHLLIERTRETGQAPKRVLRALKRRRDKLRRRADDLGAKLRSSNA